jgi:NADH-quinone oxidoreductase subunit N
LEYEKIFSYELPILMLLNIESLFILISVNDYFLMFLVLELQSLSLYLLALLKRSNLSVEAGLKYFLYGSFASGFLVYGISLIYGSMGTVNFSEINLLLLYSVDIPFTFILGLFFVLGGVFFKLGIAPFHS